MRAVELRAEEVPIPQSRAGRGDQLCVTALIAIAAVIASSGTSPSDIAADDRAEQQLIAKSTGDVPGAAQPGVR